MAELAIIILALIIALLPAQIAKNKGRSFVIWYVYGLFLFLIAIVHALAIAPNENAKGKKKCPMCVSIISVEAKICPSCRTDLERVPTSLSENSLPASKSPTTPVFNGAKHIADPTYRLFLVRLYSIEKNNTLDKYVIQNNMFESLETALQFADQRYIDAETARTAREALEATLAEKTRQDREEQARIEEAFTVRGATFIIIFVVAVTLLGLVWFTGPISKRDSTGSGECPRGERKVMNECVPV